MSLGPAVRPAPGLLGIDLIDEPDSTGSCWTRSPWWSRRPGYWMGHFADRWITGDRNVSFLTETDLVDLVTSSVTGLGTCARATIRPWRTNLLLVWRRGSEQVE